jgi:Gas vesicle protein
MALDPDTRRPSQRMYGDALHPQMAPSNLADILERVLDKGIVIAGDIQLNLLDIELITIKIRLLIASVDRAREMGINWWESDPTLSVEPRKERVEFRAEIDREDEDTGALEARIERLERLLEAGGSDGETGKRETGSARGGSRATRPASARRATGSRGGNAQKR